MYSLLVKQRILQVGRKCKLQCYFFPLWIFEDDLLFLPLLNACISQTGRPLTLRKLFQNCCPTVIGYHQDLFVCLLIAAQAFFQLSGSCHHYWWQGCKFWPMLGAQGLWAGRDLYCATPTATRDLGLYGLIRKTGTHVPQWDSNPRHKDYQIIAPGALTTAPPAGALSSWFKSLSNITG
jgi:hypothetical protein